MATFKRAASWGEEAASWGTPTAMWGGRFLRVADILNLGIVIGDATPSVIVWADLTPHVYAHMDLTPSVEVEGFAKT